MARDGVDALDFLFGTGKYCGRDVREMPVVVLLDLKIPRLHGFEVLRRLRTDPRTQGLAVIIVTSSWDGEDLLRGYSLKADGFISKTAGFEKLVEALKCLGRQTSLAEESSALKLPFAEGLISNSPPASLSVRSHR